MCLGLHTQYITYILLTKITLLITYFLDLKFLFIILHGKDGYVFIFHITKKYIISAIFDVNFSRKFFLCPFNFIRMSFCAIMSISYFVPIFFINQRK
jgi:hypothetical protein